MWHNSFGSKFRLEIWGASHTPEIGVRIEGVPQGMALLEADFEADLSRRRASAKGTTALATISANSALLREPPISTISVL